jgi:hypothetical protein
LTKLNQILPANYAVEYFTIAPNSAKIAYYQQNYTTGYGGDIYKVDSDGTNAVKLKTVSDDFYGNFSFLPDSSVAVKSRVLMTTLKFLHLTEQAISISAAQRWAGVLHAQIILRRATPRRFCM